VKEIFIKACEATTPPPGGGGWEGADYDYGARFYDPQLGRWHVPDPLAELHFDYTPYAYVYNNPIKLIDPFGMDSTFYGENGSIICYQDGDNGQTSVNYVTQTTQTTDDLYGSQDSPEKGNSNPIAQENAVSTEKEIANGNFSPEVMSNVVELPSTETGNNVLANIGDNQNGGSDCANNT